MAEKVLGPKKILGPQKWNERLIPQQISNMSLFFGLGLSQKIAVVGSGQKAFESFSLIQTCTLDLKLGPDLRILHLGSAGTDLICFWFLKIA